MINVNQNTKNAYLNDSMHKEITVSIPELSLTIPKGRIVQESMKLTERIMSGNNIEFVGCYASSFQITVRNMSEDIAGKKIIASIVSNNTETITLFNGYVDKVEQGANKVEKKITAYDDLYRLSDVDIATWYNTLSFPQTLKSFRDSLFTHLGIEQVDRTLLFDNLSFEKQFSPQKLCALDVIKSICQINVCFGKMTRLGKFDYLPVPDTTQLDQLITFYKSGNYQEYETRKIGSIEIAAGDINVGYNEGGSDEENAYRIVNNFFTMGLEEQTLNSIAEDIFGEVSEFSYIPMDMDINGLPYIECGDTVGIPIKGPIITVNTIFLVLERELSGIQALRDNVIAEGDREIHQFESNLNLDLDRLQRIVEQIEDDIDNLKFKFYLLTNTSDINIGDGETKDIIPEMIFTATKDTVVVFHAEVLVDVSTTVSGINYYDGVGEITYILNSNVISGYTPTETWRDGNHILHLLKYFKVENSGINTFEVRLKMSGGSVHIPTEGVNGGLYGQNLVASDDWNGFIKIEEHVSDIELVDITFDTVNDVVNVETESV